MKNNISAYISFYLSKYGKKKNVVKKKIQIGAKSTAI